MRYSNKKAQTAVTPQLSTILGLTGHSLSTAIY
jgi:hypothetical protein